MDHNDYFENNDSLEDILGELEGELPPEEEIPEEYEDAVEEYEEYDDGYEYEEEEAAPGRRRRRWPWVLAAVLLLIIGAVTAGGFYAYGEVKDMAEMAYSLIDEAKVAVDYAKSGDLDAVAGSAESIDRKLEGVDRALDKPLWKLAARVPGPGGDLVSLRALFGIWDNAYDGIITPALATLREHPLPELEDPDVKALVKDTDTLEAYVNLALAVLPVCERCMDDFCAIPELSISQLEEKMAEVRGLIETLRPWLPFAEDVLENAAVPAVETLKHEPLTELKSSNETFDYIINVQMILTYLDLAEELLPRAEGWLAEVETLPELPVEKLNAVIDKVGEKADELLPLYDRAEKYIPLLRAYMDYEGKREYILAIQNNAEIRATGGFPGNMGLLYLEDGKLYLSDFMEVFNVLSRYIDMKDPEIMPTATELQLFYEFMYAPRDTVINPHFPRVAEIWCKSPHEGTNRRQGVISISPTLVQDFLAIMGEEIELSNGVVLNGENAVRYLQHEAYITFFNNWEQDVYVNNNECDAIFGEAAKAVLKMAMDSLDLDMVDKLLDMVDKHIANRTMMFWLEDPEGQAVIEELGASGGLNSDPEKPEVGVYYSGTVSSKLGWYLNMDVDVGEGRKTGNAMTYPVTITLENTLSWEEFSTTSAWVVGTAVGSSNPYIFIFAPAGGTVSNFQSSNGMWFVPAEYQGLQLGYHTWANFPYGQSIVITCDVTTAPGVDAPLGVDKTPTLQEYRQAS